jgi:hypothetical protein
VHEKASKKFGAHMISDPKVGTMYILEAIATTRLRDMNPSIIYTPQIFPCGAFAETKHTNRNIYNLDPSPK